MHLRFLHIFSCLGQFIPCQCLIIFHCLDVLQFSYPSIDLKRLTHSLLPLNYPIYTIAIQTSPEDLNTLLFHASVSPYKFLLPRPILHLERPHSSFRAQLYKCYLLWEIFSLDDMSQTVSELPDLDYRRKLNFLLSSPSLLNVSPLRLQVESPSNSCL